MSRQPRRLIRTGALLGQGARVGIRYRPSCPSAISMAPLRHARAWMRRAWLTCAALFSRSMARGSRADRAACRQNERSFASRSSFCDGRRSRCPRRRGAQSAVNSSRAPSRALRDVASSSSRVILAGSMRASGSPGAASERTREVSSYWRPTSRRTYPRASSKRMANICGLTLYSPLSICERRASTFCSSTPAALGGQRARFVRHGNVRGFSFRSLRPRAVRRGRAADRTDMSYGRRPRARGYAPSWLPPITR